MKKSDLEELDEKVGLYFQKKDLYERINIFVDSILLIPVRIKHKKNSSRNLKKNHILIESISKNLYIVDNKKNSNFYQIFNLSLYLALLFDDFLYIHEALISANGKRKKRVFAKQVAVQLYEASEDLKKLLGKPLSDSLIALNIPHELLNQLEQIKESLNFYRRKNQQVLFSIRNIVGAHRDNDSILYLEKLNSINPIDIVTISTEFINYMNIIFGLLTQIIQNINRPETILQEIVKNRKL